MACCLQAAEGAEGDPHLRAAGDHHPQEGEDWLLREGGDPPAGDLAVAMQSPKPRVHLLCLCLLRTLTLRRAFRSSTRR